MLSRCNKMLDIQRIKLVLCAVVCAICLSASITQTYARQHHQKPGDSCHLTNTNSPGQCVLMKDCPSAIDLIKKQRADLIQICGREGTVAVVCCAKKLVGDISKEKCIEYSKYTYELVLPPTFDLDTIQVNTSVCAVKVTPLVVGGEKAEPKEFPHMALLGYGTETDRQWKCGGTLISDRFVLTAAHCLYSSLGKVSWVRLGELNYASDTEDARPVDFKVSETMKHPKYIPPSRYNDIALVKLNRKVQFNKWVRPACLHTTYDIETERVIATGWGLTKYAGDASTHLLKVVLDRFAQDKCNKSYENDLSERKLKYGIVPDTQLCAGGTNEEKDTCQGDSGGPLQIYHKEVYCMYKVVGVTSFGKVCGIKNIPGVYTRVSSYIEWIESTVWP